MFFFVKDAQFRPVVMFEANDINAFFEHIDSLERTIGLNLTKNCVFRKTCNGWEPIISRDGEFCWRGLK